MTRVSLPHRGLTATGVALAAFLAMPAQGQWQLLDDFDDLNLGAIDPTRGGGPGATVGDGQGGWEDVGQPNINGEATTQVTFSPGEGANRVLSQGTQNGQGNTSSVFKALPTPIADGTTGTIFYRARVFSDPNTGNFVLGASDAALPFNWDNYQGYNVFRTDGTLQVRDGSQFVDFANTFTSETWTNVWQVLDHTTDTTRIYVSTGDNPAVEVTDPNVAYAFREQNGDAGDLVTFQVRQTPGGTTQPDPLPPAYLDDIFVNPNGADLTNPLVGLDQANDGDFNVSGTVDDTDIDRYRGRIGQTNLPVTERRYDLNNDGTIDLTDHNLHVNTRVQTSTGTGTALGDLNLDGDVDVSDFDFGTFTEQGDLLTLASNLGTPDGAFWADGDLNADGDVDVSDFDFGTFSERGDLLTLASNLGAGSQALRSRSATAASSVESAEALATGEAAVAYDPSTGDIILSLGNGVIGAAVVSELGLLDVTELDTTTDLGDASQLGANAVAFSATSGLPEGTFNIGSLLDSGLTLADLGNFGVSFAGFGTQGFARITVVPEPATFALFGGGALLLARRRRVG